MNCNSRNPALELWSNGQHHPFIEIEAICPGPPTGYSPFHTMHGIHLVVWDFKIHQSRFVIPLGEKGNVPPAGGRFLVISRDRRSSPWNLYGTFWTFGDGWSDNIQFSLPKPLKKTVDALPYTQYLPSDDFFGAIVLYKSRPFQRQTCGISPKPWLCHHYSSVPFEMSDLQVVRLKKLELTE